MLGTLCFTPVLLPNDLPLHQHTRANATPENEWHCKNLHVKQIHGTKRCRALPGRKTAMVATLRNHRHTSQHIQSAGRLLLRTQSGLLLRTQGLKRKAWAYITKSNTSKIKRRSNILMECHGRAPGPRTRGHWEIVLHGCASQGAPCAHGARRTGGRGLKTRCIRNPEFSPANKVSKH